MERHEKFNLVNELSKAVTDRDVYQNELGSKRVEYLANTNTLKINKNFHQEEVEQEVSIRKESEEEIFQKLLAQRKK
ncbi:MAG: hypothetical protein II838_04240 [Lachnospiraceae bacterium]|jgi:hypothetical protein|nr:hypothetical protein [Lachnospiraceae bacterium]